MSNIKNKIINKAEELLDTLETTENIPVQDVKITVTPTNEIIIVTLAGTYYNQTLATVNGEVNFTNIPIGIYKVYLEYNKQITEQELVIRENKEKLTKKKYSIKK